MIETSATLTAEPGWLPAAVWFFFMWVRLALGVFVLPIMWREAVVPLGLPEITRWQAVQLMVIISFLIWR